ncbi:uncharacterized protein LOC110627499 isoform X1 [Manihot esculenta]|uniref:RPA-interacting protein N-terminal domain-containing protein n=1 Tax=Manihot esculenta TaxID=3983 RepID=A0A2C9UU30_MANES|nr:uncharacterized protein LOC110627499 isoform X1 [Manihot esculenta]OAY34931.1 hypothetical protein MANES_12G058800v8 [Manihot esculenta]
MENDCALSSPTPKRSSLKSQSHFNTYPLWKDKLRENCYKRVREDRNRLLWKMRLPTAKSLGDKDFIKSAFQDIVSDELKKITHSSGDDNSQIPTSGLDASDILWEYDGLHNAYQGECEEILLEMQRIFYEDLRAEPTRKEPENHIATWEDEEDEYLARAVYEHMHLNDKQVHKETWCPICKQGQLQESHQLIYCSLCELELFKDDEVNLDILTTRLAEAHTEHLDRGCKLRPKFCIETRFGLTALYIHCEVCKIFEVVM